MDIQETAQPHSPPSMPAQIPIISAHQKDAEMEEENARRELLRVSLSKAELLELAKKNPPLPSWFDEEEPPPF